MHADRILGRLVTCGGAIGVLLAGLACAPRTQEQGAATSVDTISLSVLRDTILTEVGGARCAGDGDCRTIAFGAKPCGGPWSYLVYSASQSDSVSLAGAVARYNAIERELNRKEGRASDCQMITPPRVACIEARCVAVRE